MPDDFSMVPFFSDCHCGGEPVFTQINPIETCDWMEANPGQQFVLRHPMGLTIAIPNTPCTGRIIRYIDGERSLETIFQMVAADMESMTSTPLAKFDFLSSFTGLFFGDLQHNVKCNLQ